MRILNTPVKVKDLELPSRLVMPPMATEKSAAGGIVTEKLCEYYEERARGGYIGLIITEHSYVSPEGQASKGQLSIADDSVAPGLQKLTDAVRRNGSRVFAQISHAGGSAPREVTGCDALSASAVVMPRRKGDPARAMELADIRRVTEAFAAAAERVKRAGFDGVEIHAAHGYLLNQFYSPLTNHREDEYTGASLPGRIKLHLEVIQAVREAVGADFPIALRMGACDYMEGGATVEDSVWAAKEFERAGIDLLDVSGGFCIYSNPNSKEPGWFGELSEAIKKEVSIPVLLTGGVTTGEAAEELLREGKADLIGVGRAILKDPSWAKRAMLAE